MEDLELLKLLHKKPSDGLRVATKLYGGLVKLVVSRLLPNPQDVEECVADAFVALWKNAGQIEPSRGSIRGFLLCAARNRAIDRLRAQARRPQIASGDGWTEYADTTDLIDDVAARCDAFVLQDLVETMEEPDRSLVVRKYFLFERTQDIAGSLGMDKKWVENRLYRTKQRLRAALTERGVAL